MNSKDLLRAFGDIDEKYLDEEHETPKEKNKKEFYIKIIRNKKIALLERTSSITDRIKESFNKTVTTESEIMELYSNVDMLIIDDFGSETISKWALEKLYRIINNRYENDLPIVITTRYTREELMEKIAVENRILAEEFIQILYKMCYGISLIKNDINEKEKASKSDKTKC